MMIVVDTGYQNLVSPFTKGKVTLVVDLEGGVTEVIGWVATVDNPRGMKIGEEGTIQAMPTTRMITLGTVNVIISRVLEAGPAEGGGIIDLDQTDTTCIVWNTRPETCT